MLRGRHKDLHPLLKIAEWLLIMMVCMAVVSGIWMLLPINHADTGALLLMQAMQAIGLFIVPAMAVWYLWDSGFRIQDSEFRIQDSEFRIQDSDVRCQRLDGRLALLSVGMMVTAIPLINCLVAWNESIRLPESMAGIEALMQQMEQQAEAVLERFMTYKDGAWWVLMANLVVLAILPGIGEEMAFRGVLQSFFRNRHVAVWVTAAVFSFVHFQFYGFIPRLLMGALLGYVYAWSGRLGYSIIMHVTNNALSVMVFYLGTYVWHLPQAEIDAIGTGQTWWLTAVCTPVMIALICYFKFQIYHSVVRASAGVR